MKNIKSIIQVILSNLCLLILGLVVGIGLLMLALLVPVNSEKEAASYDILAWEEQYAVANTGYGKGDSLSFLPGVLDNSADKLMLSIAMGAEGGSVLEQAMSLQGNSLCWHGYVSVLRPLLFVFDYGEIRVINSILQILLLFFLVKVIWQNTKDKRYIFMLLTSYALLMPIAMPLSLQFSWVFYIAAIGTYMILVYRSFWEEKHRFLFLFLLLGMCTCYFDLLTYPLITWGFPMVWWLVISEGKDNGMQRVKKVVLSAVSWIEGYGSFWCCKWLLATHVLKRDVLSEAIEEVLFCIGMGAQEEWVWNNRLHAVYYNWMHYEYFVYFLILAAWLVWALFRSVKKGWNVTQNSYAYGLIGLSAVVWCLVLSNHTTTYHFITYRIFVVSILAFIAFLIEACSNAAVVSETPTFWKRLRVLDVWLLLVACGVGLSMLATEVEPVSNYVLIGEKSRLVFLTVTWTGILVMLGTMGLTLRKPKH